MRNINLFLTLLVILPILGCDDQNSVYKNKMKNSTISHDIELRITIQKLSEQNPQSIQPYVTNPRYWQYKGVPILLLGASDEDNLFNHPDIWPFGLKSHLDLMVKNGGNYVRNTMSSRDHGNIWPYKVNEYGLYDLNRWNEEYWNRFEKFLNMAYERDIIVQIEIWDRFDFSRESWSRNPFNPKNNVNYNSNQSGLEEVINTHPGKKENRFFRTPPGLVNNELILNHQNSFVKKILSISLKFPNILYCISNETNESPVWSDYWAFFIHNVAFQNKVLVHITEMKDAWELSDPQHASVLNKPDLYTYLDFSQNSHQIGQTQWDNAQWVRTNYLENFPRPMNSVKIYSGTAHGGGFEEGAQKFWRNIFGGFASSRFHRTGNPFDPGGIGLSPLAQNQILSMRMLTDEMNVFLCSPSNHLLSNRESNEAYAFAEVSRQYAIYFPNGGSVKLDLANAHGNYSMSWLNIMISEWQHAESIDGGKIIDLHTPGGGPWVALIKKD
jgi:hypothetical protein